MKSEDVNSFFNHPITVDEYTQAVHRVGLWDSERIVFTQTFAKEDVMLDLGCGAGHRRGQADRLRRGAGGAIRRHWRWR